MVQLFSKVPWVYNEVGASGNLSQSQENKYAEGIINGVEKSIGSTNQVAATNGSNTSADCAAVNGSVVDTAIGLAWPSGEHGPDKADATLAYQAALPKYNDATNDYSDCGGFVATVMHASGADKSYVGVYVPNQYDYVNGTGASKYKIIKNIRDTSRLEAGDILMYINPDNPSDSHTFIFVGQHQGFDGDGAAASLGGHVPEAVSTAASFSYNNRAASGNYFAVRLIQ